MDNIVQAMMGAAGQGGGLATDPNFNQTVLLLHGDGTNGAQNNTFLDSSTNNFTITRNGNTTQGTFSPFSLPNGEWSNYFDGSGDYLSFANGTFNLGNNDFVVEALVYLPAAVSGNPKTIAAGNTDAATAAGSSWDMSINTSQKFACTVWISSTNYTITSTASVPINEWVHLAFVRTGGTISNFINGTKDGTNTTLSTNSVQNGSTTYAPNIGRNGNVSASDFPGYISNLRLIIGANASNIYDATGSSITVPTAPLTAVTNTTVVTCQSNRFVDNSSSPKTITVNGNPSVQPFSPFLPTAEYDASVNGGSGYFDGGGDYLATPSNSAFAFGTGDYTIECFVYRPNLAAYRLVEFSDDSDNIDLTGDNKLSYYNGSVSTASAANVLSLNSWDHVAIVRSSGTVKGYVNGVEVLSTGSTPNTTSARTLNIAGATNLWLLGYIANFRVVKGTAVYTSAFTPPTAPLTAISGTSLLCNFTNAGIFDNTGKNNLETVGNAQIDTTTKKYGTGSMEFDGTGDWLKVPNSPDIQLGTGDFTIEFWVYLASGDTGSARGLVAKGGASTGWLVSLDSSEKVVFTYTTSTITSSGAITTNAWNHIAVVREGTGSNETKIYIGGTNDGTGTVSTNFNQTEVMYIGANRAAGDPMKGFIDDLRITKGVARYTTTFTPPTAAFPNL